MPDIEPVFRDVLNRAHTADPDRLIELIMPIAQAIGARDLTLLLVDFEQELLVEMREDGTAGDAMDIEGTLAGRAFMTTTDVETSNEDGCTLMVPVLDGAERLGVVSLAFDSLSDEQRERSRHLANLVAVLVISKRSYTDAYQSIARRRDMTLSAELQWSILPPLTFRNHRVEVAGILAPAYSIGGDSFDYTLTGRVLRFAIVDAVGHGFSAVLPATLALASLRHSRRRGLQLHDMYAEVDAALRSQFPDPTFVTGIAGHLDLSTGVMEMINAGHPTPMLARDGKVLEIACPPSPPFGLGLPQVGPAFVELEPGDRVLFFSDGVTDVPSPGGAPFGRARLADLFNRAVHAQRPAAETVRQLSHTILRHHAHELADDFTILLVDFIQRGASR